MYIDIIIFLIFTYAIKHRHLHLYEYNEYLINHFRYKSKINVKNLKESIFD